MAKSGEFMKEEVEAIRQLRDELRVQAELGRADLRDQFRALESRWNHFEAKLRAAREDLRGDADDVREAARLLGRELREGYEHIRARLS
jgi:predicted  nucleic acid-binding Zn-ribbon protein